MKHDLTEKNDPALILAYYPYHYHTILRQSDGRGNGHVANGKIAMLADDAREAIHTHIMGDRIMGHAIQLVETNFRFFEEITYPGALTIGVGIVRIGNSSLQQLTGFFRDERCFVLSRVTAVKTRDGRSEPFTPEERTRAAPYRVPG